MLCLVVNKVLKRRQCFLSYSELGCQESPSSLTRSQLICRKVDTRRALLSFISVYFMHMQVGIFVCGRYLFRELNSFPRAHKAQGKP